MFPWPSDVAASRGVAFTTAFLPNVFNLPLLGSSVAASDTREIKTGNAFRVPVMDFNAALLPAEPGLWLPKQTDELFTFHTITV